MTDSVFLKNNRESSSKNNSTDQEWVVMGPKSQNSGDESAAILRDIDALLGEVKTGSMTGGAKKSKKGRKSKSKSAGKKTKASKKGRKSKSKSAGKKSMARSKSKSKSKGSKKVKKAKRSKSKSKSKSKRRGGKKMSGGSENKKSGSKRKANPYMLALVAIKKEVKKLDLPDDVKDGPAMSKVVSTYMKKHENDVSDTVKDIKANLNKMISSHRKANKEIAAKRAAKKAAKNN